VFAFPALPRGAEDHWNEKRVFHLWTELTECHKIEFS